MKKYSRAFTLVELLVVIAIIGILSAVVMASLNSSRAKGRDGKRISDIKQIQLALALYQDANNYYPTAITTATIGPFIGGSSVPTDPSNGQPYRYAYYPVSPSTNVTHYHLGASLEAGGTVLNDDKDCNSTSGTGCPSGAAYTGGFTGADSGKCDSSDFGTMCFDVTP